MEKIEFDYLNLNQDKDIRKFIKDEIVLFSDKIHKINRFGFSQDRNILITLKAIYNIKKKELKRKIDISVLRGITTSSLGDEFVLHCNDIEYDYHFISPNKRKIIGCLAKSYNSITQKELKICEFNSKSLKSVVTTKKEKKKDICFSKMPESGLIPIGTYLLGFKTEPDIPKKGHIQRSNTLFSRKKEIKEVKYEEFNQLKVLGRGTFGKVCLVEYIPTKEIYAMKSLKKDVLIEEDQIENTLLEKKILQNFEHPFLTSLIFCFQTEERIHFIMPFLRGGELFQHLKKLRVFDEEKVRFYAAQIALALDHLHSYGIVYRDLKPENILLDEEGYLKLADFGMAKHLKENEKTHSFCGTPEYLAPEIITGEGHNKAVDWWSFGILIFEMIFGIPPFYNENADRMYELIKLSELRFPKKICITPEAQDLIQKLLNKNPELRLGYKGGISEIKSHKFFSRIDFDMIYKKKIISPYKPEVNGKVDVSNFDNDFTSEPVSNTFIPQNAIDLIKNNENLFKDF